jgi:hypothetical protein
MMPHAFRIESRGSAFDGYFTNQTRLDQIPQIVIHGRPGTARVHTIHGFEDFRGRGVAGMFH